MRSCHSKMKRTKNIVIACGLGDSFIHLTRLQDFFEKNPEYTNIRFWAWNHSPKLLRQLCMLAQHDVSVMSVSDMTEYLRTVIHPNYLPSAERFFIKQHAGGVGVDKYLRFIEKFFSTLEEWVYLPTYNKYKGQYPYKLKVEPAKRTKPYIVVHPYSTTVETEKPERLWKDSCWGKVLHNLHASTSCEIILIGTYKDIIETRNYFPQKKITDLRGKTSFEESIALVYGARAVIGINSWPALMASWAGIPTYMQWFVQQQLLPTHLPKGWESMQHIKIDLGTGFAKDGKVKQPTGDEGWETIREFLNAAGII